jgi:hypothetical protein
MDGNSRLSAIAIPRDLPDSHCDHFCASQEGISRHSAHDDMLKIRILGHVGSVLDGVHDLMSDGQLLLGLIGVLLLEGCDEIC